MREKIMPVAMLKKEVISIDDKTRFEEFLKITPHVLSVYNFANIFIWRKIFDIFFCMIGENLCIFFKNKYDCFMYLSPQGKHISQDVLDECFAIMDSFNLNKQNSRIENIEAENVDFYRTAGFSVYEKYPDYVYLRSDLANLKGDRFKSKRAGCNYFYKHYRSEYLPVDVNRKDDCISLCRLWMQNCKKTNSDYIYQSLLDDTFLVQTELIGNFDKLGVIGRMVEIDNKIQAYSFGYELNKETFCIIFEVSNKSYKGISQFIFREFCRELSQYKYINIMDDSGLVNLQKTKLSYRPFKQVPNHIIRRMDG